MLREDEHYAPPALEINGTIYRVIGPGLTTDNFIIQTSDLIVRMDAGSVRGIMFCALLLQHLTRVSFMIAMGRPWGDYEKSLWYWQSELIILFLCKADIIDPVIF